MSIDWSFSAVWEFIATFIFVIAGAIVYIRLWKYVQEELKISPRETKWQKFKSNFGAFLFCSLISVAIIFVAALIVSAIAINALHAFQNTLNPEFSSEIIGAFQFPRFLPITLIIITGFAVIYPFYEYLLLGRRTDDAPMEVQRWIESHIINRVNPPGSYFVAILMFILIVLLVPTIISLYAIYILHIPEVYQGHISAAWTAGIIFADWVLIGPIFYLSYYAKIGTSQAFFQGLRLKIKRNTVTVLFFIFALISIISSISGFIQYIPIIWGQFPQASANYSELNTGFFDSLVEYLMRLNPATTTQDWTQWNNFIAIFPLDFLIFVITTCIFGLIGFYVKFINKEPLNRTPIVVFAAYIICGIAFTIFTNTIIKWPWMFPGQYLAKLGLNLDFTNINDQQLILDLFSPSILIGKIVDIVFLIYFLFINKEVRRNTDVFILNNAIANQELGIIKHYRNHKNIEMRRMVASAILNYMQIKDKYSAAESTISAEILTDLIIDSDSKIRMIITDSLFDIALKLDEENCCRPFKSLFESKFDSEIRKGIEIANKLIIVNEKRFRTIFDALDKEKLSDFTKKELFRVVQIYGEQNPDFVQALIFPLIDPERRETILNALTVLKYLLDQFSDQYITLAAQLRSLLNTTDARVNALALELYSVIAIREISLKNQFLIDFAAIHTNQIDLNRARIGAIASLLGIDPDLSSVFEPYFKEFYDFDAPVVRSDLAVSLGSIALYLSVEQFIDNVFPYFTKLVLDENFDVKKAIISSLLMVAKIRQDIYSEATFQRLLSQLLLDDNSEIRNQVYVFLSTQDPIFLIQDFAELLRHSLNAQVQFDILNHLEENAEKFLPYLDQTPILDLLINQNVSNQYTFDRNKLGLEEPDAKYFGFPRIGSKISTKGALIAVLYEFAFLSEKLFHKTELFFRSNLNLNDDCIFAKTIAIYGKCLFDRLKGQNHGFDKTSDEIVTLIWEHIKILGPLSLYSAIEFLSKLNTAFPDLHPKIFGLLMSLRQLKHPLDAWSRKKMLILMGSIIASQFEIYFHHIHIQTISNENSLVFNPFKNILSPFLRESMQMMDPIIQEGVDETFEIIVQVEEQSDLIRHLLLKIIDNSVKSDIKLHAMNLLLNLPFNLDDYLTVLVLIRQLNFRISSVRAKAINILGKIIQNYPPALPALSRKYKRLEKIVYRAFFLPYTIETSFQVKEAIIDQLNNLVQSQPHLPLGFQIIRMMGEDPSDSIAIKAMELYCQYLDQNPQYKSRLFVDFRNFANTDSPDVQQVLLSKVINFYQNGLNVDEILPTLIKLGGSSSFQSRQNSLDAFREIYLKDRSQFILFLNNIFRLTRHREVEIRRDACRVLFGILFENVENLQNVHVIFSRFQGLSRDPDLKIKMILATYLVSLFEIFPKRVNSILQIVYSLIRSNDNELLHNCNQVLTQIYKTHPELEHQIKTTLQRIFRKSQNAMIMTILNELN